MLVWLLLTACLEPFGADRHDLEGFRVAGVRVAPAEQGVHLEPVLAVNNELWSDDTVDLRWFAVADPSEVSTLDPGQTALATGSPALIQDTDWVALIATAPSGEQRRAVVDLSEAAAAQIRIERVELEVVDKTLSDLGELVPTVEERQQWSTTPATVVAAGGIARLTAHSSRIEQEPRARWMTLGGAGHYLELSRRQTDWFSAELDSDDEELLGHSEPVQGWVTGLTVLVDGSSGADWRIFELFVGNELPRDGAFVNQRFLPMDPAPPGPGLVRGTLELDDTSPTGLRLTGAEPVSAPELSGDDPYGTAALPCGAHSLFDPDWLAAARCTRSDVVGAVVVVEAQ